MSLTHRMQLMLDEAQYERLADRAASEGRSIGALIREAIDRAHTVPDIQRQQALDIILQADPMHVPDPAELHNELEAARGGKFA